MHHKVVGCRNSEHKGHLIRTVEGTLQGPPGDSQDPPGIPKEPLIGLHRPPETLQVYSRDPTASLRYLADVARDLPRTPRSTRAHPGIPRLSVSQLATPCTNHVARFRHGGSRGAIKLT